jgi:hypothetical protein
LPISKIVLTGDDILKTAVTAEYAELAEKTSPEFLCGLGVLGGDLLSLCRN